jgi:hypothetical protein
MNDEQKKFSATDRLVAMQELGSMVLKCVEVFGADETAKLLRASARVVASGKAVK